MTKPSPFKATPTQLDCPSVSTLLLYTCFLLSYLTYTDYCYCNLCVNCPILSCLILFVPGGRGTLVNVRFCLEIKINE